MTPRTIIERRIQALEASAKLQRRTLGVHCDRLRAHRGLGLLDSAFTTARYSRAALLTTAFTLFAALRRRSVWGLGLAATQWWWRRSGRRPFRSSRGSR